MLPYQTSRDYDLLLRLMPAHRIVCFVDYRFPSDSGDEPPCRDVCATRYDPPVAESDIEEVRQKAYLAAQARGIAYAGGWRITPERFKKDCAAVNLEFILPPEATPVNPVPPVNEVPLKRHGDALLHS